MTITRGTVNNTHYSYISPNFDDEMKCGLMRYVGVWALGLTSDLDIGSQWPDDTNSGQAGASENRTNKVLEGQTDADQKAGRAAAMANNPYPNVQTQFPANWDVFEPVDMQLVAQVVPADRSPTGVEITLQTVPLNVTVQHVGGPIKKIQLISEGLTDGKPGHYIDVRPAQTGLYGKYSSPIYTPAKIVPTSWGTQNTRIPVQAANSAGLLLATQDGYVAEGGWRNISPTSSQRTALGTAIKLIADPGSYRRLILFGSAGALVCDDKTAAVPVWRSVNLRSTASTGQLIATLTVPATGGTVSTPATVLGQAYRVDFSGTWIVGYDGPTALNGDACYRQGTAGSAYNTTDVQCYIDGAAPSPLPAVSAAHTYSIALTGTGSAFAFQCHDGNYSDNSGSISALVYQLAGSSDEVFIADMQGSINRPGYFCWLVKRTVSGTDYVYFSYTTNYFRAVQSKQVAKYDSSLIYSISLRSYNSTATGVVLVSAGATSDSTAKVYRSANWGSTWSATTQTITARGGLLNVPYAKSGGAANSANPPQYALVRGTASGNIQGVGLAGGSATIVAGTAVYPFGPYSLNSFTLDGAYLSLMMRNGSAYWSSDAGVNWAAGGSAMPGSTSFIAYGMTGSPTNKSFGLGFGYRALAFTSDRGSAWTDLWANYRAFAGTAFSGAGEHVISAFADLTLLYSQAVRQ